MREVCFLISRGDAILWADASDSATALPDSRARWEAIWRHRDELAVIAHSHPAGPAAFSAEDESTMQAIDSALGRVLRYCVVAPRVSIGRGWTPAATGLLSIDRDAPLSPEPWWAGLLRLASGMRKEE